MKNSKNCDICNRVHLKWDTLLFENKYGLFVKNSKYNLVLKNKAFKVGKRFSVSSHLHIKKPNSYQIKKIKDAFEGYLLKRYGAMRKKDYDFFVTMNTYPNHWHMHACFYPFMEVTKPL